MLDLSTKGIKGQEAEDALAAAHITSNRNPIPFDNPKPAEWLGLRLGVAAATTRGLDESAMEELGTCIADLIDAAAAGNLNKAAIEAEQKVAQLCAAHPLY